MFDVVTPREVYAEYEDRKARLNAGAISPATYFAELDSIAHALGVGVDPSELTDAQRAEQNAAMARWAGRCGR